MLTGMFLSVLLLFSDSPDYDVVVYLNDVTPNEEVLEYFWNFIDRNIGVSKQNIKKTKFSLHFRLDGISFDLVFAKNEGDTHSTGK